MAEIADVFLAHSKGYVAKHIERMLPSHRRVIMDVIRCRTPRLGGHVDGCKHCGKVEFYYHSCLNRHCPKCSYIRSARWVERRAGLLLHVPHFHMVFTIPHELNDLFRRNQSTAYAILMRSAADATLKLTQDPRYVGGTVGGLSVLHTWTRSMSYHPHVHLLVSGGGLTEGGTWRTAHKAYLVPYRALEKIFKAMLLRRLRRALPGRVPDGLWSKRWVVDVRETVHGGALVVRYLGRYVKRIAISNRRIAWVADGKVGYRYQRNDDLIWRTRVLGGEQFMREYLQHALPKGFTKVRYFGLYRCGDRKRLMQAQSLVGQAPQREDSPTRDRPGVSQTAPRVCSHCKVGIMAPLYYLPRRMRGPPELLVAA